MLTKSAYHQSFYTQKEDKYYYMYQIPPKMGCYKVLDTETTGSSKKDHIIELGGVEVENGEITVNTFHIYIRPRVTIKESAVKIHGIKSDFFTHDYKDKNIQDKVKLEKFLEWVGDSIIFSHNAPFDMLYINRELNYWKLKEIPKERFRCTMRIFRMVLSYIEPLYDQKYTKLMNCCEYFGIIINRNGFHRAQYDCNKSAELLVKIYEKIDIDPLLNKKIDYLSSIKILNKISMFI